MGHFHIAEFLLLIAAYVEATEYNWVSFDGRREIYLLPEKKYIGSGHHTCAAGHCSWLLRINNKREHQLLVEFMKENNLSEVVSRTWAQGGELYEFDPYQLWGPNQPDEYQLSNHTHRNTAYSVIWDSSMNYTMNDRSQYYDASIICSRDIGTYCDAEHPDPLVPGKSGTWERYFGEKGHKFTGSVLSSEENVNLVECMEQCFYDSQCFLVNFYHQENTCEYLDWSDKSKVLSEETVAFELK